MFSFCGHQIWLPRKKNSRTEAWENIFSAIRLPMMRDDSWLAELEVIHLFVSFCSFCVKETKKKWDYKSVSERERS